MIKNDLRGQEVFLQVKSLETSGEHWAWIGALCFSHYIFTQCPLESKEMGEELPQKSVEKKNGDDLALQSTERWLYDYIQLYERFVYREF